MSTSTAFLRNPILRRRIPAGLNRSSGLIRNKSYSTVPPTGSGLPPQSPRGRSFSTLGWVAAAAASTAAYVLGSVYPPQAITLLYPRIAPPLPTDPTEVAAYTAELENALQTLPVLKSMRSALDAADWYETRPYTNFPEERRVNNLSAGSLRGPGKFALPPLVRAKRDEKEAVIIIHLGRALCGHEGIIHGGILATILDESLARVAINNLPDKVGVTAKLSVNYRAPTKADQFVVLKTHLVEARGRVTRVAGRIEDANGNLLVESTATFVQPKYAKLLNTSVLRQAMGEPTPGTEAMGEPQEGKKAPVHVADGAKTGILGK